MLASVHLTITNNTPFSLNREREWLETGRDDGQEGRLSPGGGRQVLVEPCGHAGGVALAAAGQRAIEVVLSVGAVGRLGMAPQDQVHP